MEAPEAIGTLRALEESEVGLTDLREDLRRREVRDIAGEKIGTVEQLLIDDKEKRIRLLLVEISGLARGVNKQVLIPIEAITGITEDEVWIKRTRWHVVGSPLRHFGQADQRYLESVYAYYGYYPYWAPGYVFPSYQGQGNG